MTNHKRHSNAWRRTAGFSIAELLVAVLLSSIVVLGIFVTAQNSSRTFQVQMDGSMTVDQLNFAMEFVKQDLRRAAFLTVPNAQVTAYPNGINVCGVPPNTLLQALEVSDSDNEWEPPSTENGPTAIMMVSGAARVPDQLTLLGAFRTNQSYPVVLTQGNQLRAEHGIPGGGSLSGSEVDAIMRPVFDRALLAVYSRTDSVQFVRMTTGSTASAVSGATNLVAIPIQDTVEDYVSDVCDFGSPWSPGRRVVPLHRVRYRLVQDLDNPNQTAFVREELGADNTVLDRVVVANNIIDFQVWFDQRAGQVGEPLLRMQEDGRLDDDIGSVAANSLNGTALARPELARYAYIQMSARLQNPISGLEGSGLTNGLRDVVEVTEWDDDADEAVSTNTFTRVVTIRTEVDLTNFALAD